jgi:hypothetical protein
MKNHITLVTFTVASLAPTVSVPYRLSALKASGSLSLEHPARTLACQSRPDGMAMKRESQTSQARNVPQVTTVQLSQPPLQHLLAPRDSSGVSLKLVTLRIAESVRLDASAQSKRRNHSSVLLATIVRRRLSYQFHALAATSATVKVCVLNRIVLTVGAADTAVNQDSPKTMVNVILAITATLEHLQQLHKTIM